MSYRYYTAPWVLFNSPSGPRGPTTPVHDEYFSKVPKESIAPPVALDYRGGKVMTTLCLHHPLALALHPLCLFSIVVIIVYLNSVIVCDSV